MAKKSTIIINENPFDNNDRTIELVDQGTLFIDWLKIKYPNGFNKPTIVHLNCKKVEVKDFDFIIGPDDVVILSMDVGEPVTIALAVLAVVGVAAAVYAIEEIDSLIDPPDNPTSFLDTDRSPTYSVRAQTNIARPGEPIPVQYGKLLTFPDLAAKPWVEYVNNDQFLHQLFCLGQGDYEVEEIKIGELPVESLDGFESEVVTPGNSVTLFDDNIYTNPLAIRAEIFQTRNSSFAIDPIIVTKASSDHIQAGVGTKFKSIFNVGDVIILTGGALPSSDPIYGEYTIASLTNTEIEVTDPSTLPLSAQNINLAYIIKKDSISFVVPGFSINDFDRPYVELVNALRTDYTTGYITTPLNIKSNEFYIDIENSNGLYQIISNEFNKLSISVECLARPLKDNSNNFDGDILDVTGVSMKNITGNTYNSNVSQPAGPSFPYYTLDTYHRWDQSGTFVFYDNGVAIPAIDIQSIDYGDEWGGAKVTFTGPKAGPITFDGRVITMPYFEELVGIVEGVNKDPLRTTILFNEYSPGNAIPLGRYMLFFRISNGYVNNTEIEAKTVITGVKSKLETVSNYGNVTLLATKIKATPDINASNSKKFNVLATRKLPIWNGSSFDTPSSTRSPAWAFADAWLNTYGGSRSFEDLDLTKLLSLDSTYTSRGDTFDAIFDQSITVWEGLNKIANSGRAKPSLNGKDLSIFRDEAQAIPVAMFNKNNIINGSFSIEYAFNNGQRPDGIQVKYLDEDENYKERVLLSNPNSTRPKEISLFGTTNYDKAYRDAKYEEAKLLYANKIINFDTELEGHILLPGQLILISIDFPKWAEGGEVIDKTGLTITVTDELDFSGGPYSISFREIDGTVNGPHTVTQGAQPNQVVLGTDVTDMTFYTSRSTTERTMFVFGPSNNFAVEAIVKEVIPKGHRTVGIRAFPQIQAIYDADTGAIPPKTIFTPSLTPIPPKLSGLKLKNDTGSGQVIVSWNPAFNIDNYVVEKSTDNSTWIPVSTPTINTETINATGILYVRVAAQITPLTGDFISDNIFSS